MVLMCDPMWDAVNAIDAESSTPARRVLLSPQGTPLNQEASSRTLPLLKNGFCSWSLATTRASMNAAIDALGTRRDLGRRLRPQRRRTACHGARGFDAVVRQLAGRPWATMTPLRRRLLLPTCSEHDELLLDCPHYTRPREWRGMRRFLKSSLVATTRPSRQWRDTTNRSSARDSVAPTSTNQPRPLGELRINPCRGNPTVPPVALKGNNRARTRTGAC